MTKESYSSRLSDGRSPPPEVVAEIDALIAAEDWRAAAERARSVGWLERAESLYVDLLDYESAGEVALAGGDPVGALGHWLRGGHDQRAESLRQELISGLSEHLPAAIDLFVDHDRLHAAAELASSVGRLERAARLFREAHSPLEAARLYERIGRWREAGELYEAHLSTVPASFAGNLGMARVLQRFDRHSEACRAAHRALAAQADEDAGVVADDEDVVEVRDRFAYSLLHLRLREAAELVVRQGDLSSDAESGGALFEAREFVRHFREHYGIAASGFSERYRVRGEIHGPYVEAYAAHDTLSGRDVLIQPLHGDEEARREYLGVQRRLASPPIGGVLELVDCDESTLRYAVFEHPGGETLEARLRRDAPLSSAQAHSLATQICNTLTAAHRRGVLHGSLNPRAVFIRPGFGVVLAGFGLSQLGSRMETATMAGADNPLAYLPPELAFGGEGDFRSDFYGLGALLWRVATGSPPTGRDEGEGPNEALFDTLLATELGARPGSHRALEQVLRQVGWAGFPVAGGDAATPSGESEGTASEESRFVQVGELTQGEGRGSAVECRDTWLERTVVRVGLDRPLSMTERDRVRALADPSAEALQPVLGVDAEAGHVDLAKPPEGYHRLDDAGLELGRTQAARALAGIASSLAALHGLETALGGFGASEIYVDARRGSPFVAIRNRLWSDVGPALADSESDDGAARGDGYVRDAASVDALAARLLGAYDAPAGPGLAERAATFRAIVDAERASARAERTEERLDSYLERVETDEAQRRAKRALDALRAFS